MVVISALAGRGKKEFKANLGCKASFRSRDRKTERDVCACCSLEHAHSHLQRATEKKMCCINCHQSGGRKGESPKLKKGKIDKAKATHEHQRKKNGGHQSCPLRL